MILNKDKMKIIQFALQCLLADKQLEETLHSMGEEQNYTVSQKWNSINKESPLKQPLPAKDCPNSTQIKDVLRDVSLNMRE